MKYNLTISFSIFFLIMFGIMMYMHEFVHISIYSSYNIPAKIDWFGEFPNAAVIPEKLCSTETCTLLNEWNEIVGYNATPIFIILGGGLLFIICLLEGIYFNIYNALQQTLNTSIYNNYYDKKSGGKNGGEEDD